ncbi:MAG TPA: cytochrome c oxidase assembly protein [Gemmatimonadales bacterium]|nr:cytochrome c oxidase assembly protein [Gemmatimonadales bacterium]
MTLLPGLLLHARAPATVPWTPALSLHWSTVLGTAVFGALYGWGVTAARRRWNLGPPAGRLRIAAFATGLLLLLVSLNGPIHDLSDDYLFTAHMLQHLVLTMAFPPLIIFSMPGWLLEPLVRPRWVQRTGRFLAHPIIAGVIFTVVLSAWHLVPVYDLMMQNHDVHIVAHLLFIIAAFIMWWPVMSPVKEVPALPHGLGMLYLFLVSVPMQIPAALITMADTPLYRWYVQAPRTFGLTPLEDQRIGGLLMWIPGNLWIFGAIAVLFFLWNREQEREDVGELRVGAVA